MLMQLIRRLGPQRKSKRLFAEAQRLYREGALEEAERACIASANVSPDLADIHYLRGLIALRQERTESAVAHLEAAISERDSEPSFHLKLAEAFQTLNRHERAVLHFTRALERLPPADPTRSRIMLRLAAALQDCNNLAEAERWYRRILEIEPDHRDALLCLAVVCEESDVGQARSLMDRYIALQPDAAPRLRRALMLPAIVQSNEEIDGVRNRLERDLDELLSARLPPVRHPEFEIGATAFQLAYHGRNDSALMRKLGRVCRSLYPARTLCDRKPFASGSRLRIGFVSSYFHDHSVARTTFGFSKDLPRKHFEVHVFAIAPRADDWADAIRRGAEHYAALPLDLDRVRRTIDAAALDILFFTDIGMDPLTYFLAFWRLAPIQLVAWGHPATTGIDTVDYFVSASALEPQGSDDQYTEKLMRLPGYFMPRYLRPMLDGPRKSREELGLPAGKHLYCCLQNLFKFHPDFDTAIKAVLERDPEAEILLLESRASWMDHIRRRFSRTLGALASRVRFIPRMARRDFLQHIAAADVILDPFHFGGGNSSCEPLSLGVPVVTLPAFQLRGKLTLGLYKEMGLDCCVARSPEEFVEIAVRLAREPDHRHRVSGQIAARCERLFDRPDAALALGEELIRIAEAAR